MVKVGIVGADTPLAGEIIRILCHHPETEMVSLFAPSLSGRSVSSLHHGLIGEVNLNFTEKFNLDNLDVVILAEKTEFAESILNSPPKEDGYKVISIFPPALEKEGKDTVEIGLSEINRKALVRGADKAFIPSPLIVPSLIALSPLASFLLLNSDIDIEIKVPSGRIGKDRLVNEENLMQRLLMERQSSFTNRLRINVLENPDYVRGMSTEIAMKNSLPIDEIEKIYEQTYDDHNFSFLSHNEVATKEVEGTQKVVFSLEKPDADTLIIHLVSDIWMRGGAGDVIHVLNLFFGLHEKTGLHLKVSQYQ